jgi:phosphotriesterase-related protein
MVHTNARHRTGLLALEALTLAGVDPRRIVVAHAGDSNDLDYLRALADTGAWLGLDRFGWERFNPDEQRVETLLALLEAGYGDRLHLGHDAACFFDFMAENERFAPGEGQDYLLIPERIVPRLREAGVAQAQLDELLVENPRRFISSAG